MEIRSADRESFTAAELREAASSADSIASVRDDMALSVNQIRALVG